MMSNRIRVVEIRNQKLTPTRAELEVRVWPAARTGHTEIRGRLTGPRCAFAATVEIAYPLLPLPLQNDDPHTLRLRAVIPEPNLWEPETPFLYHAHIELWEDGHCCDRMTMPHALRAFQVSPTGFRLNGKPWTPRVAASAPRSDEEWLRLRQEGLNTLLALPSQDLGPLRLAADRLGFLVFVHQGDTL